MTSSRTMEKNKTAKTVSMNYKKQDDTDSQNHKKRQNDTKKQDTEQNESIIINFFNIEFRNEYK